MREGGTWEGAELGGIRAQEVECDERVEGRVGESVVSFGEVRRHGRSEAKRACEQHYHERRN